MQDQQKEWTRPEIAEFDISERTQFGDGPNFDGIDFEVLPGGGGPGGGGPIS